LGKLASELSEKVEGIIAEAREDAQGYEHEALAPVFDDLRAGASR
jgi:hypothetical protein